jgi:hypothetical protein
MTKNSSLRGVSGAFLAIKEKFDEAFVNWCSVVGASFADDGGKAEASHQPVVKLRKSISTPMPERRNGTLDIDKRKSEGIARHCLRYGS